MPKPRLPLRRIALCIALGAVTSWLVAWATICYWLIPWPQPNAVGLQWQAQVQYPYLYEHSTVDRWGRLLEAWKLTRIDNADPYWQYARDQARNILLRQQPDSPVLANIVQGPTSNNFPTDRTLCGTLASDFAKRPFAKFASESSWTGLYFSAFGWPFRCVSMADVTTGLPNVTTRHWQITVAGLHYPSWPGAPRAPLRLPLRPLFPGLLLNTTFYAALWSLPFFTLPLLKQRRRQRRGHCPRCNYNLNHALTNGCPECGWNRPATA